MQLEFILKSASKKKIIQDCNYFKIIYDTAKVHPLRRFFNLSKPKNNINK